MKINKITLVDVEIKEVDGEYQKHYFNETNYPAFLTNYALKKGKEMGLIESSLVNEVMNWSKGNTEDQFNENKMLPLLYLSILGAEPDIELTYEEFVRRYHYSLSDTMELYSDLVDSITESENNFSRGLINSTNKSDSSKKK